MALRLTLHGPANPLKRSSRLASILADRAEVQRCRDGPPRLLATAAEVREDTYVPPSRGQLSKLAMVSSIPFVGFGFMDNVIMILAGDAIDASIGVKLGVSTMAAAGLGNTLSDCVGLFTGDWIESLAKKAGIREPKLTEEQLESREVRWTKTSASVVGLAFGCIMGMFPLAFHVDRKPLYFSEGQEEIYEKLFRPYGVTLQHFFTIMKEAKCRNIEAGTLLAEQGTPLRKVFMLCEGSAVGTGKGITMHYTAKADTYEGSHAALHDVEALKDGVRLRGSIIGGTCLVDPKHKATELPYPYEVRASSKVRIIEWPTAVIHEIMESDKAVESAVVSMLYADLAESSRRSAKAQKPHIASENVKHDDEYFKSMKDYSVIVQVATADDFVHPAEKRLCEEFRLRRGLSSKDHAKVLQEIGWTNQ